MKRQYWPNWAGGLLLATVAAAQAADLYVDADNATGTELGTQNSPFRTVQAAIDAAGAGTTSGACIVVAHAIIIAIRSIAAGVAQW